MQKILERLKGTLDEESLNEFKIEFEKLVESRAVEYAAEKEKILEKAAEKMIAEELKKETALLAEKYEAKLAQELKETEELVTETVTMCIKDALKEAVSDDMISKIALAEMYQPIIEGTQQLFENHLVKLSPSATKKIKYLEEKCSGLEHKLDEAIEQNFEHQRDKEAMKRAILIEGVKLSLTPTQSKQLDMICEGVEYETLEKNMDKYIQHIQEASLVDPRKYLSEQDEIAMHQRKRWPSHPKAMGDLDEAETQPMPAVPDGLASTDSATATKKPKRLIFRD